MASIPFVPESPRHLMMKSQDEKAWTIIKDLHSRPEDANDSYAKAEFEQIKQQVDINKTLHVGYLGMFTRKSFLKRVR